MTRSQSSTYRSRTLRAALAAAALGVASLIAAAVVFAASGLTMLGAVFPASAHADPRASAARTLTIVDTAHMHLVKKSGSHITETGYLTGTLPGSVRGTFNIGASVSISVTLYPRSGGSIRIHGTGNPVSSGSHPHFRGSLTVTGGTGRYAHAHGSGHFAGVVDRHTWAMTTTASGNIHY